jgi:hypothetical protein
MRRVVSVSSRAQRPGNEEEGLPPPVELIWRTTEQHRELTMELNY